MANNANRLSAGEAVLQLAAQTQGLDLTVVRPSLVFGAGDQSVNLFARLQSAFPVMPLAGAGALLQPVWVQDLARALVAVLRRPETAGQTFEVAGPRALSLGELVQLAGGGCRAPGPAGQRLCRPAGRAHPGGARAGVS